MVYPKLPYVSGKSSALLHCDRMQDAIVRIRPELPGNIIVIHGVNDVGASHRLDGQLPRWRRQRGGEFAQPG